MAMITVPIPPITITPRLIRIMLPPIRLTIIPTTVTLTRTGMGIPIRGRFILRFTLAFMVTALAISTAFMVLIDLTDSMETAALHSEAGRASEEGVPGRLPPEVLGTVALPRQASRGVLLVAVDFVPAGSSAGPVVLLAIPAALAGIPVDLVVVVVGMAGADTAKPGALHNSLTFPAA